MSFHQWQQQEEDPFFFGEKKLSLFLQWQLGLDPYCLRRLRSFLVSGYLAFCFRDVQLAGLMQNCFGNLHGKQIIYRYLESFRWWHTCHHALVLFVTCVYHCLSHFFHGVRDSLERISPCLHPRKCTPNSNEMSRLLSVRELQDMISSLEERVRLSWVRTSDTEKLTSRKDDLCMQIIRWFWNTFKKFLQSLGEASPNAGQRQLPRLSHGNASSPSQRRLGMKPDSDELEPTMKATCSFDIIGLPDAPFEFFWCLKIMTLYLQI